jgi:predicted nucleic acid-binding protein
VIVVDTSVWIEVNRRSAGVLPHALRGLIDADEVALALPVRLELSAGAAAKDRKPFLRALSALPVLRPTEQTWDLIERWIPLAADQGHRFALADLMIAALAREIGALVWSLDEDFGRLEGLNLVQMYAVPMARSVPTQLLSRPQNTSSPR